MVAPMPGTILRHVAEVGQTVSECDPVVILEAMKMENALPSPAGGVVKEIWVPVGSNVATNDVVAIIGSG